VTGTKNVAGINHMHWIREFIILTLFYIFSPQSAEYKEVMPWIQLKVNDHKTNLVPGEPQLNMCDRFVMVIFTATFTVHKYFLSDILSY
jgi:alpha-galactosidase/6-phospho-beta-glucosidase family protein